MPAQIIDEQNLTPELDATIRSLLCTCFPADASTFSKTRAWNGSAPSFTSLVHAPDGREVLSHIGIVDRTVSIGGTKLRVAGIQNVAVDPAQRGKGLTDQTMHLAMEEARTRNFDLGLLFCLPQLEKLYSRLGWRTLPETEVTRIHEGQPSPLPGKNISMFFPLKHQSFPAGPIHLNGDDW